MKRFNKEEKKLFLNLSLVFAPNFRLNLILLHQNFELQFSLLFPYCVVVVIFLQRGIKASLPSHHEASWTNFLASKQTI